MMMRPLLRVGEFFSCFLVVEPLLCSDFGLDFFVVSGRRIRVLLGLRYRVLLELRYRVLLGLRYRLCRSCRREAVMFLPLWFPL